MRLVIAATIALLPLNSSAAQPEAAKAQRALPVTGAKICATDMVRHAQSTDKRLLRTLDRLPPGDLQLAVHRQVDGCFEPVIIRQDIGGNKAVPKLIRPL